VSNKANWESNMNTTSFPSTFNRSVSAPRGAEPLASLAAALLRWGSLRVQKARERRENRRGLQEMWALAAQSESTQPSLASELYAAARRYEGER
jgi:hypothetical protein